MTAVAGGAAVDTAGEPGRVDTFFLGASVPTGAQPVIITRTNNATIMYASAATQTAAGDTEVYTPGIVLLQESGAYAVQSVTDGSTGVNSVRYAAGYYGANGVLAAGAGSTALNSIDFGSYTANTARETAAGQGARNVGFTGASDDRAAVHLAVREIPSPPTVTSIAPNSGPTTGGTAVTITGSNFSGATAVTIGGVAATSVVVVSATSITAVTPAGTAGPHNVVVTTPGGTGTGTNLFTYLVVSTVTASPTACINVAGIGTQPWGTLTGPLASNNAYATASVNDNQTTNYLQCTGYGFAIPAGAIISGITVNVERMASGTLVRDAAMRLVSAGVVQATDRSTLTNYTTVDVIEAHGGAADLWGGVWTAADINAANFGAALASIKAGTAGGARTVSVDHMSISVDYTLPPPTVLSINLASVNPTNPNTSVDWTVTFDQSITGVDAADFLLVPGGSVTGASITGVTGSGTTWTVTANTGSGTGTLGLNLVDDDTIAAGALKLGGTGAGNGNFTGQVYTVEAPMTCITDSFSTGTLDTSLWDVRTILGPFLPQVINAGGGDYRLRLTDTGGNEATFAQLKRTFPGAGNKVVVEIDYFAYGGSGADGVAVTFSDSAISSTTGGFGGSLGYAQNGTNDGFGGGWLGIGLDEYGNFPNPTESRNGYPAGWVAPAPANVAAGFYKTNVSVRGSGSATSGYNLLANTGVLATPVAPASGAAGATPYRYRFTIDHSNGTNAWVTVERDTTATGASYLVLVPTFDVKAANSGQAAVPASWLLSFTGSTGGATNNHEIKQVTVCANSIVGGGPHHFEIQHASGTEVTCNPSTLTIKACADALAPCTPYTGGVGGTLSATGTPTVNWDGTTGGAAGAGFDIPNGSSSVTKNVQVTTVGTTVFDATATPAATAATTCNFGTPACTFTATDSGFIVTAPDHAAETASTLTIQAVKSVPGNPLLCTTGMTGAKTVNLKCSYVNPASGTLPVRIGGTPLAADAVSACSAGGVDMALTFNASGVAAPTLQYADVGEMLISANFTGTPGSIDEGLVLTGGGSFIAAPASFDFSAFTAGTLKAGDPFSATVRALNAAGAVAPNFGKESEGVTLTSSLVTPDPVTYPAASNPAPGNNAIPGTEFGAGGMVSDANGVATVDNLSWGEVGSITLTANLTSGSYLGSGLMATGTSATVGPFIPHHFDTVVVASASVPMPCPAGLTCPALYDGFVYSGQPFSMQVFARNLAGGTTTNYDGTFGLSKNVTLTAWNAKGGATQNPGSGALGSNAVAAAAFSSGVATLTDTPTYTFDTTPTAPTDIYMRAVDTDSVTSLRAIPANSVEGGVKVASGRVKISNTHGSELLPLPMTATVQYHDGTNWLASLTDSATSLTLGLSNYQCKTGCAWTTTPTPASGQAIAGVLPFKLSKPTGGGTGSVDVSISAPDYLLTGSNGAGINPSRPGRATFGVYKGNNEFIYLRETY